jgi:hypothetical protein
MIRTISRALSDKMFTVVSRDNARGVFQIRFGTIPTVITIQVLRLNNGRFEMATSHAIQTELQLSSYWVHHRVYDTPGDALDDFQCAFSLYYEAAQRKGYEPKESWLVAQ